MTRNRQRRVVWVVAASVAVAGVFATMASAKSSAKRAANPDEPVVVSVQTPPGFRRGQHAPVLLALPPGDQSAELARAMLERYWGAEAAKRGWVVVSLAARPGRLMFQPAVAKLVPTVLDRAIADTGVVPSRTAVGGVSNGGLSAFRVALDNPTRFSALVVAPGYPPNGAKEHIDRLVKLRVAMWVGAEDTGWVAPMRAARNTLKQLGANVSLVEVANSGHIISDLDPVALFDALDGK